MNKYWDNFYKTNKFKEPSNFAKFCEPLLDNVVELGCGEGRDLNYFLKQGINAIGVDQSFEGDYILKRDVEEHIKKVKSPDCVYTRFFWHSIPHKTQLKILKWVKGFLFIEARTTQDKPKDLYGSHKRYLVNVPQLVKDLKSNNFQIVYLQEGIGFAKHKNEDPHIIRVIASKQ
jgi:hypothetical protein